ncbi:MAG: hypothetical protein R3F43_02650 [bacterium]
MTDLTQDLEQVYKTAIQVGLADVDRRDLLLAWLPADLTTTLKRHGSPADQLRSDLQRLLAHELATHVPALTTWLENAERLTDYLPGVPSIFAAMRRKVAAVLAAEPPAAPPKPPSPPVASAIGIQFLCAAPVTDSPLRQGQELRDIRQQLGAGLFRDRLRMSEIETAVRLDQLQQLLWRSRAGILHFSGHGTDDGALRFEGDGGAPVSVTPSLFARPWPRPTLTGRPRRARSSSPC